MNTAKVWILAARSRTLTASISPVLVACALAQNRGGFSILLALICLLVALLALMAFKLVNDYFGYGHSRLRPERAMLVLIACMVLFYGIVPVCASYYILTGEFSITAFLLSLAMGALSANILVVNNHSDMDAYNAFLKLTYENTYEENRRKVVIFERRFGSTLYLVNGFAAIDFAVIALFPLLHRLWALILFMLFIGLFLYTWHKLRTSGGRVLGRVLRHTMRNVLIFAVLLSIVLL